MTRYNINDNKDCQSVCMLACRKWTNLQTRVLMSSNVNNSTKEMNTNIYEVNANWKSIEHRQDQFLQSSASLAQIIFPYLDSPLLKVPILINSNYSV